MNRLCLRLVLALAGCASCIVAGSALAQTAAGETLARVRAARAIQVAFSGDSLPLSFVADNGQPARFSIDLCRGVIARIGRAVDL